MECWLTNIHSSDPWSPLFLRISPGQCMKGHYSFIFCTSPLCPFWIVEGMIVRYQCGSLPARIYWWCKMSTPTTDPKITFCGSLASPYPLRSGLALSFHTEHSSFLANLWYTLVSSRTSLLSDWKRPLQGNPRWSWFPFLLLLLPGFERLLTHLPLCLLSLCKAQRMERLLVFYSL